MKEKNILIINSLKLLIILPLYYIIGNNNIFLYILSLSLYHIFTACFSHISIKESLKKYRQPYIKQKMFHLILLTISVISLAFLLLSIAVSDIVSTLLNISNVFLIFIMMGLSIISVPALNILIEYVEDIKSKKVSLTLFYLYHILDNLILLIISIFVFIVFDLKSPIKIALLYLSKIISIIIIYILGYLIIKPKEKNIDKVQEKNEINYQEEVKKILTKHNYKSIIYIVKKSYYYISIIILYLILTTRYGYATDIICQDLAFIYFYLLSLIEYIVYIVSIFIKNNFKNKNPLEYIYLTFKIMISIAIILTIISPLLCKILFNDPSKSIYLTMLSFMAIFISLYDLTYHYIKNKKVIYISLISGLISKIILIIPLINSFYRMGYNLIYGDVISTMISMLISIIINYIYLHNRLPKEKKYLEKFLKTLYENILLCIILIICQFIIPIKADSYFKSLILIVVYLFISLLFIKVKNKKRG